MATPIELFQTGNLVDALTASTNAVRSKPADLNARSLLCELLCFAGELERADKQLDAAAQIDPNAVVGVSLLRHLIRSELSRREVYEQGRVPDFLFQPTAGQQCRLRAILCVRDKDYTGAAQQIAEAVEAESPVAGEINETAFDDIRDLDDLVGPTLEVYTATGKYYWIGFEQLVSLEFNPVEHLSDMLWRSATIETTGDVAGRVHIPALYNGSHRSEDQKVRIGRATDWNSLSVDGPIVGAGQREFLAGEESAPIMEIRQLRVTRTTNP